jgi:thiol-disulfide isomerase/thioredoxin
LSTRAWFALVGVLAMAAGTALWLLGRPARLPDPTPVPARISPAALYATGFNDLRGTAQSLGQFQGKVLVLNFWATWCAPCREEMPAFQRLHSRWAERGVRFVGISAEEAAKVAPFAASLGIEYPLWVGADNVAELSRRLGNHLGVLPHTALIGPGGEVLETRVGPYTEKDLEARLAALAPKS